MMVLSPFSVKLCKWFPHLVSVADCSKIVVQSLLPLICYSLQGFRKKHFGLNVVYIACFKCYVASLFLNFFVIADLCWAFHSMYQRSSICLEAWLKTVYWSWSPCSNDTRKLHKDSGSGLFTISIKKVDEIIPVSILPSEGSGEEWIFCMSLNVWYI